MLLTCCHFPVAIAFYVWSSLEVNTVVLLTDMRRLLFFVMICAGFCNDLNAIFYVSTWGLVLLIETCGRSEEKGKTFAAFVSTDFESGISWGLANTHR